MSGQKLRLIINYLMDFILLKKLPINNEMALLQLNIMLINMDTMLILRQIILPIYVSYTI